MYQNVETQQHTNLNQIEHGIRNLLCVYLIIGGCLHWEEDMDIAATASFSDFFQL